MSLSFVSDVDRSTLSNEEFIILAKDFIRDATLSLKHSISQPTVTSSELLVCLKTVCALEELKYNINKLEELCASRSS